MRFSRQRERIRELVKSGTGHPTAEWVHKQLKAEMPGLSLGTVYRNLRLLASEGAFGTLDIGDGVDRFDCRISKHYHFVCDSCGAIQDLEIPVGVNLEATVAAESGLKITGHSVQFRGLCKNCS